MPGFTTGVRSLYYLRSIQTRAATFLPSTQQTPGKTHWQTGRNCSKYLCLTAPMRSKQRSVPDEVDSPHRSHSAFPWCESNALCADSIAVRTRIFFAVSGNCRSYTCSSPAIAAPLFMLHHPLEEFLIAHASVCNREPNVNQFPICAAKPNPVHFQKTKHHEDTYSFVSIHKCVVGNQ